MARTGTIDEVAALVHYLASREASFTTGSAWISAEAGPPSGTTGRFPRAETGTAGNGRHENLLFFPGSGHRMGTVDASSQHKPNRRGQEPDGDVLAPAGDIERVSEPQPAPPGIAAAAPGPPRFTLPISALGPLFRYRFEQIYLPRVAYHLDINDRATTRVLGGYYKSRRLVRIYLRERGQGVRPTEELFDTFLHEMAHHLEYTEPFSFSARRCGRVPGRMHSRLFWKILGELKYRWARVQEAKRAQAQQVD